MSIKNENKKIYNATLYYRISNDDRDLEDVGKSESNSIKNQRELIKQFVKNKTDIVIYRERIDDGYTGVNFERPSFKAMIEDIKAGRCNCIIVKDLSRFGRNYIEVGNYIEKIFPYLDVRFIAINDNYDSLSSDNQSDSIILPFKNLMNDAYSRDISTKVRSQLEVKRNNGDFVGAFATYGYKKNPNNKNQLIVDEKVSHYIRDIFSWRLEGMSNEGIAKRLNSLGVESPLVYKKSNGTKYSTGFIVGLSPKWSANCINRILTNKIYIGTLIQGKTTTPNHKVNKKIHKEPSKWNEITNSHEAIISNATFEEVQRVLKMDTRVSPLNTNLYILSGIVKCGKCGENMVRRSSISNGKKYNYRICSTYKKNKNECKSHAINEEKLINAVTVFLKRYIDSVMAHKDIIEMASKKEKNFDKSKKLETLLHKKNEELEKLERLIVSLPDDFSSGLIDNEEYYEFKNIYSNEINCLQNEISSILNERIGTIENKKRNFENLNYLLCFMDSNRITRGIIIKLVNRVVIFDNGEIEVELNFKYDFSALLNTSEEGVICG